MWAASVRRERRIAGSARFWPGGRLFSGFALTFRPVAVFRFLPFERISALFAAAAGMEAMACAGAQLRDARAKEVFDEMVHIEEEEKQKVEELKKQSSSSESLQLQRKYIYPFVLAVLVLAFTQATGIDFDAELFREGDLKRAGAWKAPPPTGQTLPHQGRELLDDYCRHGAGGPQGPQVPVAKSERPVS